MAIDHTEDAQGKLLGEQKFIQAHFGERSSGLLDQLSYLTKLDILEQLTDQLFQNYSFEDSGC